MIRSISIIYPVYNEEKRLNKTILDLKKFDKKNKSLKREFIFVNDGSSDNSSLVIRKELKKNKNIKLISYHKNKGKGYALKKGIRAAKNKWILTTDADCSVSNLQLTNWIKRNYLEKKIFIYFGSRNHKFSIVKKKKLRKIVGLIFKFAIRIFFKIKISDTQCGFKLYKSSVIKKIFKKVSTDGYMHDIEICLIARKYKYNIKDLPIKWSHIEESKINFLKDFFKISLSLFKIFIKKY